MTSRYWDSMGNLVKSLVNSIASIAALLVLLMLSIFIAALLGMQIFGGKFDPDSRSNFNGIVPSTVTVFQVPGHFQGGTPLENASFFLSVRHAWAVSTNKRAVLGLPILSLSDTKLLLPTTDNTFFFFATNYLSTNYFIFVYFTLLWLICIF